jgi:hypothetical protein
LYQLLSKQRRSQLINQKSTNPTQNFNSIDELMKDEANILAVLNTFAQNCKECLRWRIESDGSLCVAEIRIGQLNSSAVKSNKKSAKLAAAKNLLKAINSNTYFREKFFYYSKNLKESHIKNDKLLKESLMEKDPKKNVY